MIYFCCQEHRREAIKAHSTLNGIDYLEVLDRDAPTQLDPDNRTLRQRTLLVRCFKPLPALNRNNVKIEGGTRITTVNVLWAYPASAFSNDPAQATEEQNRATTLEERSFFFTLPQSDRVLVVRTDSNGDFSPYRLSLVQSPTDLIPLANFDPQLSTVDFSFKVECPSEFDCQTQQICSPEVPVEPEIDYLAKDYLSFRQLMLDRLSVLVPQWTERNPADVGVTLVELLAYVADRLSYQQDAIATEAYLGTAKQRISIRRHARLVDYFMHDGCNARVWIQLQVSTNQVTLQKDDPLTARRTRFLTKCIDTVVVDTDELGEVFVLYHPEVFEPIFDPNKDIELYQAHNTIDFYTWGATECCLPKGATHATLKGHYPNLTKGDVLILAEVKGATTGQSENADRTHRHAVRLTDVIPGQDPLGGRFLESPNDNAVDITEITWSLEDALPFPLCISSNTEDNQYIEGISVALGNIILADHGLTITEESIKDGELDKVPCSKLVRAVVKQGERCQPTEPIPIPPRFRPQLAERPLTQAATTTKAQIINGKKQRVRLSFDPDAPATAALRWKLSDVLPAVVLLSRLEKKKNTWQPRRDLLNSNPDATDFVAEVTDDSTVYLRFGDDQYGLRPNEGTKFEAVYRVGNGIRGNVGVEAIAHISSEDSVLTSAILAVRNPLPAQGGVEPESIEDVRQKAPSAFRKQERAVTPADYAEVTERHPQVQRAAATFRWTGSWYTVFVTVDRLGGLPVDKSFKAEIQQHLEQYRMAGHDLEIDTPRFVSLEIEMAVCVLPDYFRSDVKAALLEVFSNRILPDGRRGIFHPDNFSFGQAVYLSSLYAAAQAVPGVASVEITIFQRQGTFSEVALETGKLDIGRLEIARLDNDPNFPENGIFTLKMVGGK